MICPVVDCCAALSLRDLAQRLAQPDHLRAGEERLDADV
jgi:hypothetical protein